MFSKNIRSQINAQKIKVLIVLGLLGALVAWQEHFVVVGFTSNVFLNGGIVAAFAFGVCLAFVALHSLKREEVAFTALQEAFNDIREGPAKAKADPFWRHYRCLEKGIVFGKPKLLGHIYELTIEELLRTKRMRIPLHTMESMVSAVQSKMVHERALLGYLTGLLVFLGLIGTFIGLMEMVQSVGGIIGGLAGADAGSNDAFRKLLKDLEAPLVGMATGFSASLFGLFGSLVLGLITRFVASASYAIKEEYEAWLASVAQIESTSPESAVEAEAFDKGGMVVLAASLSGAARSLERNGAAIEQLIASQGEQRTLALATYAVIEKLATEQGDLRRTLGSAQYTLAELPEILRQEFLLLRGGLDEAIDRAVGRVDEALSRERSVMEMRLNEHQFGLTRIGQTMTNTLETELNLLSRTLERMRSSLDDRANKVDSVHQDILSAMRGLDSRAEMKDELRAVAKNLETTLGGSVGALAHAMNEAMAGVAASIEHFSGDQEATARKLDSLNDARLASQELRALAHAMETGLSTGFGEISRALAAVTHFNQQAGRAADLATEPFSPTPPPQPVQAEEPAQKLDRMAAVEEFYANARRRMSNGG